MKPKAYTGRRLLRLHSSEETVTTVTCQLRTSNCNGLLRRYQCQKEKQSTERGKMRGKARHRAHKRENSCGRRWITSGRASMARVLRNKPLRSAYRKRGGPASSSSHRQEEKPRPRHARRRSATTPRDRAEPRPSRRPSARAQSKRLLNGKAIRRLRTARYRAIPRERRRREPAADRDFFSNSDDPQSSLAT